MSTNDNVCIIHLLVVKYPSYMYAQSNSDDAPHLITLVLVLYVHVLIHIFSGLDQPGFVTSSNFLLPWEVVIKGIVKDQAPWPHVGEPTTHKQRKKMSAKRRKCCCTPC